MYKIGELIRWRSPLDEDYSYGYIVEMRKKYAVVQGTGYYTGSLALVHIKNIKRLEEGGESDGRSKKHNKRSTTQIEL